LRLLERVSTHSGRRTGSARGEKWYRADIGTNELQASPSRGIQLKRKPVTQAHTDFRLNHTKTGLIPTPARFYQNSGLISIYISKILRNDVFPVSVKIYKAIVAGVAQAV
jgi:hypothetical protein